MVSADPRQSSLTADFRTGFVRAWGSQSLPPLAGHVIRGGPLAPAAAPDTGGLQDQAGTAITDEAGSALS